MIEHTKTKIGNCIFQFDRTDKFKSAIQHITDYQYCL